MYALNKHTQTHTHTYTYMHKTLPKPVLINDDSQAMKSGQYNKVRS